MDYASNRACMGIGFSKTNFLRYAADLASKRGKPFKNPIPTEKWWKGIKKRSGNISLRKPEATASVRHACMNRTYVSKYIDQLENVLKQNNLTNKPEHLWNMDETGCSLSHNPGFIIAKTGSKYLQCRTSGNRETITLLCCGNAGGNMLPPLCVVKGKTVKSLQTLRTQDAPAQTRFTVSNSGWTKMGIMERWFKDHFLPLIGPERPQLLVMDGHNSHNYVELLKEARDNNIIMVELPEHTSHWLQPLDRTVFGPFKKAYNKVCGDLMNENPGTVVSKGTCCGLLEKAWVRSMTAANLKSGFRACGVYPFDAHAIPNAAFQPNSATRLQSSASNTASVSATATVSDVPVSLHPTVTISVSADEPVSLHPTVTTPVSADEPVSLHSTVAIQVSAGVWCPSTRR